MMTPVRAMRATRPAVATPFHATTQTARRPVRFLHARHSPRASIPTAVPLARTFTSTARRGAQKHRKESFSSRLRDALSRTRIQWAPIPVGLGIGFLGFLQFRRMQDREKFLGERGQDTDENGEPLGKVGRRERIRPSGPWTVQVMSTLPLKAISRIWGKFNELDIPYYLRIPGFKLYGWVFGVK